MMIFARDVMNSEVVFVDTHTTLDDAIDLLLEHKISGLPVVNDKRELKGIISEFALLVLTYDRDAAGHIVGQHMTRQVISVEEDTLLSDVADLLILNRVRRVPVTRAGRLTGIISRRDLLRAAKQTNLSFARPEPFASRLQAQV